MTDLILPDSRWEQPELLYPNRKPVGNVKIDWEHPLARGLAFSYYDNSNVADLSAMSPCAYGVGTHTKTTLKDPEVAIGVNGTSCFLLCAANGTTAAWNDTSLLYGDTNETYPNDHGVLCGGFKTYGRVIFGARDSSTHTRWTAEYDILDGNVLGGELFSVGSTISDDSIWSIYGYGKLLGAEDLSAYTFPPPTISNHPYIGSSTSSQAVLCVFRWDRELSDVEHASIAANPYQFLIPA